MMSLLVYLKRTLQGEVSTKTLVKRGLKVGENFRRGSGCFIDPSHCFLIQIGNNVTFSINVTLLAHDASTKSHIDYTKIGKIVIGDNCFVGAGSIILPNVSIGENSIIAAGSVVTKDVPPGIVFGGNPAKMICDVDSFVERHTNNLSNTILFDESYVFSRKLSEEKICRMRDAVEDSIAYIR